MLQMTKCWQSWTGAIAFAWVLSVLVTQNTDGADVEQKIDFQREIRPLLAKHCFKCHGPDEQTREAGLRLDLQAGATEDLGGYQAVYPGDPDNSELLARIIHEDPDLRMPPGANGNEFGPHEVELLRQWILEGGAYETHWAFVPPQRMIPEEPQAFQSGFDPRWSRDPIDDAVLSSLAQANLLPNAEASRETLLRRLCLDLTGLPPLPSQVESFVQDDHPMAYAKQVDRLLADPASAERWSRVWLDLARYADTNGYEKDRPRTIWPYRDWIIHTIAQDMPFDQFTIQQIAGDMLPEKEEGALVATGFHRNTMLNEEGGIDPLEYRYLAMVDRVATVGTVWMGMTIGCAQCHTHKYDPITHQDYFRMMALLNNADEPELVLQDDRRSEAQKRYEEKTSQLIDGLVASFPPQMQGDQMVLSSGQHFQQEFTKWLDGFRSLRPRWVVPQPAELHSTLPKLRWQEDGSIFADGDATKRDEYRLVYAGESIVEPMNVLRLEALPDARLPAGGPGRSFYEGRRGDFFLSEVEVWVEGKKRKLERPSHSYGNLSIGSGGAAAENAIDGDGSTGWSTSDRAGQAHQWVVHLAEPIPPGAIWEVRLLFERHFAASLGRFRISMGNTSEPSLRATVVPAELEMEISGVSTDLELPDDLNQQFIPYFIRESSLLADQRGPLDKHLSAAPEFLTTMVMRERAEDNVRPTYIHHRGEYLQPRDEVTPGIPEMFRQRTTESEVDEGPRNRLEFAQWLVSRENPLVARVTVNRIWREIFGKGLVRTAGDFGTQSQPPEYPGVLDRLAVDMMDEGWSLQRVMRRLVHSSVYRQSSDIREDHQRLDPENTLLARAERYRLSAEAIRDSALVASGQISREIGGPSVRPPQDPAVTRLAYGSPGWEPSPGGDRYRRSIYTFAKRTAPFAAYLVFDGPTGENCLPRRDRSNTPLQALTLLNDPMFVELAEALARNVLSDNDEPESIATEIFVRILSRYPRPDEVQAMLGFVERVFMGLDDDMRQDPVAVWKWVARGVMNTDEALMRQ